MATLISSNSSFAGTVLLGVVIILYYVYYGVDRQSRYLGKFVWVGRGSGIISAMRGNLNSIRGMYPMAYEGYNKFSKRGVPFAIPSLQSGPVIMLPRTLMREALSMPETVFDHQGFQDSFIHLEYTIGDSRVTAKDVHRNLMKRNLNQQLPWLVDSMHDEIRSALEDILPGEKDEVTELVVFEAWMKVVVRVICRQCVGIELCRDKEFLQFAESFSLNIFAAAALIDQTPAWLQPIVGPMFSIPARRNIKAAVRHLAPTVTKRIQIAEGLSSKTDKRDIPNDILQWLIESAIKNDDMEELEIELLTSRLLLILMSAIHTPTATMTSMVSNVWSLDNFEGIVSNLRQESDQIYESYGNSWTQESVDRLHLADSVFRETLRFAPQLLTGVPRRVIASDGFRFANGITIPQHALIAFPVDPIHHDTDIYPNADQFKPFRFTGSEMLSGAAKDSTNETAPRLKGVPMSTLSDDFFGFGQGRHACPGRFFGSILMKLMLAHVVSNYDIELKGDPRGTKLFGLSIPSRTVRMVVKHRNS